MCLCLNIGISPSASNKNTSYSKVVVTKLTKARLGGFSKISFMKCFRFRKIKLRESLLKQYIADKILTQYKSPVKS